MANVDVLLLSKDYRQARYPNQIEAMTNLRGEFESRGLEPIEYSVTAANTYAPDATILRDANGKPTGVQGSDRLSAL
jgi:hypothetical protein